jgi:integrase
VNSSTARALPHASTPPHLRLRAAVTPSAMTLQAFLVDYIQNHINQLVVAPEMRGMLVKYFGPLLPYALADITPLMVESWFHAIGAHSHSQANKSLSMLRTMFEQAKDWRMFTGDNPAQRVKKYHKHARTRFVQPKEMPALMAVLQLEPEKTQCFFLLCLLVGCRRTEGLTLKWADLDVDGGLWHKSRTKTGLAHTIPIPLSLLQRIAALPRRNEFVFATKQGHWCKTVASERWAVIRTAAGIPDVTIHDLRRTCASWLSIHGANLAVIGRGVLNHTSLAQTGVYARLNVSPVALEENSTRMLGSGASARPVIPREPTPQTPGWSPSRVEEREEWPG